MSPDSWSHYNPYSLRRASGADLGMDTDAESASSLESLRPFDRSRVKPGPGALQPTSFDPLRHDDSESFWHDAEKYFHPVSSQDVSFLRNIPVNPYGAARDDALKLADPPSEPSIIDHGDQNAFGGRSGVENGPRPANSTASGRGAGSSAPPQTIDLTSLPADHAGLNSFPFTHRLVAALIDEGGGGMPSSAPQRPARGMAASDADQFWAGMGTDSELRLFQRAMEDRVVTELREAGLLMELGDPLQSLMRQDQWQLRDVKTANRARKSSLYTLVVGSELRRQAIKREMKKHEDKTEIYYLERMIKKLKKNKKARNKYPKLLAKMFKNYKKKPVLSGGSTPHSVQLSTPGQPTTPIPPTAVVEVPLAPTAPTPPSRPFVINSVRAVDERPVPKPKSVKKRKKSEPASSRPPPAAKSAASKGKLHHGEGSRSLL
jgi:hypothetical protein